MSNNCCGTCGGDDEEEEEEEDEREEGVPVEHLCNIYLSLKVRMS